MESSTFSPSRDTAWAMPDEDVQERGGESIVLASFKNRFAAERMVASLGRNFRREARKGKANVFVISGNADGSLKLTESRAVEASGAISTLIRVTGSILVGFMGLFSTLKEAVGLSHAARARAAHVGLDDVRSHEILDEAGPGAAVLLIRCRDQATRDAVTAKATDSAVTTWDGSLTEFLGDLDPGSKHDWVRAALGEPSSADGEATGLSE
jgi:uncharacterized membrane protein